MVTAAMVNAAATVNAAAMVTRPRNRRSPMIDPAMGAANSGAAMDDNGVSVDRRTNENRADPQPS